MDSHRDVGSGDVGSDLAFCASEYNRFLAQQYKLKELMCEREVQNARSDPTENPNWLFEAFEFLLAKVGEFKKQSARNRLIGCALYTDPSWLS